VKTLFPGLMHHSWVHIIPNYNFKLAFPIKWDQDHLPPLVTVLSSVMNGNIGDNMPISYNNQSVVKHNTIKYLRFNVACGKKKTSEYIPTQCHQWRKILTDPTLVHCEDINVCKVYTWSDYFSLKEVMNWLFKFYYIVVW